jgi:peptide/nickel transport system substrate-binding protein
MQIAYSGPWIPDFPVPYNYYDPLLSCAGFKPKNNHSVNISEFCDPDIDNLAHLGRALGTTDPAAGNLLWQQLDQKLTDASAAIFTTTWKAHALVSRRLGNYTHTNRLPDVRPDVGQ